MIRNIRISILNRCFRNVDFLKAIALMLQYHARTNNNTLQKYSINKISQICGMHYTTAKKRVSTLLQYGVAKIENGNLVFLSVKSKHKNRNAHIPELNFSDIAITEKTLYALLICTLQSKKDFCKSTILRSKNPRSVKEYKDSKALLRKYGYSSEYIEKGLSYKAIACKLGVCIKTAFEFVKWAAKFGFLSIIRQFHSVFLPCVGYRDIPGYTFTTSNHGYIIEANRYIINKKIFSSRLY